MAQMVSVRLSKGEAPSLGFRLQGGKDFGTPLIIQKVNIGSPAEKAGLLAGDSVIKINNTDVYNLRHKDAQDVIIRSGPAFEITVQRGGSTWKPAVTPVASTLPKPQPTSNSYAPVTKTSLAANPQPSIGAIGTGHNVSAKPFAPQLNGAVNGGGPKLVNKQYNTPLNLYSEQSIAETLSAQAEVLSTGVLGVNFKKNEKNYDASNSAVFRMVQEADKEPREPEPVVRQSHYYSGQSHATTRSTTPLSDRSFGQRQDQKSNACDQGMTKCSECDRVIVGVFVRIKDKNLHVECFKCATCGTSLKNVGYYNINNKLYCDVHAKLAARTNPPAPNLVPVTVPPGGKAPAGNTISAALSSHPLPSSAAPLSPSSNVTAQPYQVGTNFSSPRPFSSVTAPLSPPTPGYSTLPKPAPVSAPVSAPFSPAPSSEKGRSVQNIIWPPPPDPEEPELPTATPLYFPPPTHIRVPTPPPPKLYKPLRKNNLNTARNVEEKIKKGFAEESRRFVEENKKFEEVHTTTETTYTKEEFVEEESYVKRNMDPKLSICSTEISSITDKRVAVETIESAAETQMLIESVLKQRPRSPPPIDRDVQPRVEVETRPLNPKGNPSNEPRVVTRVCVCTNSCCNATSGELCESCPMRDLKRPADYQKPKVKPVENTVPKRYGSPVITGVSVTINNPQKIRESSSDTFSRIPVKRTTTALGSALVTAPKEPFQSKNVTNLDPIPLPEETTPYLPPDRPVVAERKPEKKEPPPQPDTPFISALRIAPERPFTPTNPPAPVYKKKPKEDPIMSDLPKPTQWMSMVSALTTAPDRPYSPFVAEVATKRETVNTETQMEEITKIKESQQRILERSAHNQTVCPKPFVTTKPVKLEKFDPVNDDRVTPQMSFPPVSDELKSSYEYHADYSEIKSEISSQIIEQACVEEESKTVQCETCKKEVTQRKEEVAKRTEEIAKKTEEIAKQTEETILKKPLELTSYLHKAEYLPQYQVSLQYDETIQLPHHKDIKKLLPPESSQSKPVKSYYTPEHLTSGPPKPLLNPKREQIVTKPITTIQPGEKNPIVPQMTFQAIEDDKPPRTSFSPRPGSLTPSMINKPPSAIPQYQANLVYTEMPAPEINVFDPKSPAISRSPSPCPERRSPSPFGRMSPRPRSPAPGPPPNPLKSGVIPKFTKEDRLKEEAKRNISSYIPQYMERYDASEEKTEERKLDESVCKMEAGVCSKQFREMSGSVKSTCERSEGGKSTMYQRDKSQHVQASSTQQELCQRKQQNVTQEEIRKKQAFQSSQEMFESTQQSFQSTQTKQLTQQVQQQTKPPEQPFKTVKNPDIEPPGVVGMRLTNPQPLSSPFLQKVQAQSQIHSTQIESSQTQSSQSLAHQSQESQVCQKGRQPPVPPVRRSIPQTPISASTAQPKLTSQQPNASANLPSSQPNAGSGTGKQAGAVGFAPKRGRGVLNVGGLIGSRIAICGHCHGQIRGPFVTALGKIWCPEHFACNTPSCRRPLADLGFVEEQGALYCEYCFEQYLAPPCSKCGSKVKGDCLKAIGKNFHPECFNCSYCGKLFGNSPFFLEDGQPYCENDWNELFTTKCFACGFPVEAGDRWVEALNNNYHSQCFNCTMCKKNLEGQSFFAKGGRPFCKNHAR